MNRRSIVFISNPFKHGWKGGIGAYILCQHLTTLGRYVVLPQQLSYHLAPGVTHHTIVPYVVRIYIGKYNIFCRFDEDVVCHGESLCTLEKYSVIQNLEDFFFLESLML